MKIYIEPKLIILDFRALFKYEQLLIIKVLKYRNQILIYLGIIYTRAVSSRPACWTVTQIHNNENKLQ